MSDIDAPLPVGTTAKDVVIERVITARNLEIERLRARIIDLETQLAIARGTLASPESDAPAAITHDVQPNAPR